MYYYYYYMLQDNLPSSRFLYRLMSLTFDYVCLRTQKKLKLNVLVIQRFILHIDAKIA